MEHRQEPLPRGRHRLSREQVVASQRVRMLTATAEAMKDLGYARTSVAEIIRRAGVSRETFYQQFRSKEDCFTQALDAATEQLADLLEQAWQPAGPAPEKPGSAAPAECQPSVAPAECRPAAPADVFRRLLSLYLTTLAEHSAFARLFLVEVYAAGPAAMDRRMTWQQRFADAISEIFRAEAGSGTRTSAAAESGADEWRFACEALVAAAAHMVTARLIADDLTGLRTLEDPLVRLAVRLLG